MWTKDDLVIEIDDPLTDDPIVTATIRTPDGDLMVMAEVLVNDKTLSLRDLHLHGVNIGPLEYGYRRLRALVAGVMDTLEKYDAIVVQGAVRTSGAGKGHRPRPIRFSRAVVFHQVQPGAEHPPGGPLSGDEAHVDGTGPSVDDEGAEGRAP
jgi:hypothetical protein